MNEVIIINVLKGTLFQKQILNSREDKNVKFKKNASPYSLFFILTLAENRKREF